MSRRYEVIKPLLPIVLPLNAMLRGLTAAMHHLQLLLQWGTVPVPEWFDTHIGQYYLWRSQSISWMWDRGVFAAVAMHPGDRVLDMCCGSGFYSRHFYSGIASRVVGIDFDPSAIAFAKKHNTASNTTFELHDIRRSLPPGPFDAVVWDAAIEHFTEEEIAAIFAIMKSRMSPNAILSSYTIRAKADGSLSHPLHEYEPRSKEDFARFFKPHFKNVYVFERDTPQRHNLHLWASDGPLPFGDGWSAGVKIDEPALSLT